MRNPPRQFTCLQCGRTFERIVRPSSKSSTFEFCSPRCRNKGRALLPIPCPICGKPFKPLRVTTGKRKRHCSSKCAGMSRLGKRGHRTITEKQRETVIHLYPTTPASELTALLGMSVEAIQNLAYRLGVKHIPATFQEIAHGANSERMRQHNPMKQSEAVQKIKLWRDKNPDKVNEIYEALQRGHQRLEKHKPTKLELRLCQYLDDFGIEYEHAALIKDKFVVDVRIGNLIIQADGDYWHGHPRFEPLTERQIKQQKRDRAQDKYLTTCGYTVARIWESDMSKESVKAVLRRHGLL